MQIATVLSNNFLKLWLISLFFYLTLSTFGQEAPGNMLYKPFKGIKKLLFIRVVYPDFSQHGFTDQEIQNHSDELAQLFEVNSYGQVNLEIDITPVLMMPKPSTFYMLENRLSFVRIRSDAIKIAEDEGYMEGDYDKEAIYTKKLWPQEPLGVGSINLRTYYSRKYNNTAHAAHELGHTLDWRHANFFKVVSSLNPIDTSGEVIRYGDKFDIMGDALNFHHFNPWYKNRAGWLPDDCIFKVENSGTYTLRAIENSPFEGSDINKIFALKLHWAPDQEFWIYYRKNETLVNNGALISQISPRNTSLCLLLDMTPGSQEADHRDAALAVGKTLVDPQTGLEISVLEKFDDSLHVRVLLPDQNVDVLPVIEIQNPKPGVTVKETVNYEATAFDPDIGIENGAGIDSVVFVLGYGVGDNFWDTGLTFVPVVQKTVATPPYIFTVNSEELIDEVYTINVGAVSSNGGINTASLRHIIDNTGPSDVSSSVKQELEENNDILHLEQNFPNPFYQSTSITYTIKKASKVELNIYDLYGKRIHILVQEEQIPGTYTVFWNGYDYSGNKMESNIFFYEITIEKYRSAKKMILLK